MTPPHRRVSRQVAQLSVQLGRSWRGTLSQLVKSQAPFCQSIRRAIQSLPYTANPLHPLSLISFALGRVSISEDRRKTGQILCGHGKSRMAPSGYRSCSVHRVRASYPASATILETRRSPPVPQQSGSSRCRVAPAKRVDLGHRSLLEAWQLPSPTEYALTPLDSAYLYSPDT
jgi:hypothetical protein